MIGDYVVDLGSGGGLPGIPLAITNPQKQFLLVESNTKKASFLLNTVTKLNLHNTEVINDRIENIDSFKLSGPFRYCKQSGRLYRGKHSTHRTVAKEKGCLSKINEDRRSVF